ncbi:MAG: ABC-F family ATP-binding cassette domain-containing protein [Desulfobulbaceae bacterium]|nr:ABC-F family ATP-binding cassette domain-containing protein [Desulfobulbaceae bacterium]
MALLLSCQGLAKAFGAQSLFSGIDFVLHSGDRVGLIGPNGTGKSTLLKIISGRTEADAGKIFLQKHTQISFLAQEDSFDEEKNIIDNLLLGLAKIEVEEAEAHNRAHTLISRAEFPDPDCLVNQLSGGWRKRLAICRALIVHPDILIMDEPTNHLDIEGILWLEKLLGARLAESPSAFIMVSHDRRFLENTVNRIVELSPVYPDGAFQVEGVYSDFLIKRQEFLEQQQVIETRLANKMRRETEWLRRGPKARATKAKYRIDEAGRLQEELGEVRARNRATGKVQIDFSATGRKTKKLLTAKAIGKGYDGRTLFSHLDLILTNGARIGVLGRNGCGKSTLMQLLEHAADYNTTNRPDSGTIETADNIRIVSFDQRRQQLDQEQTLKQALSPDGDSVIYRDQSIHVVTWAQRFLFRTDQLETPVKRLSGGEQARILIARLMRQPADILLLDEPTNDLDIPSLGILEESLLEFPGALVLVTHDRLLLEKVCDQVLGFDGTGRTEFFADYQQWLDWLHASAEEKKPTDKKKLPPTKEKKKSKKLSYMDQREYDGIEEKILIQEERLEELQTLLADPETVADQDLVTKYWQEQQQLQTEVEQLYDRWQELEAIKDGEV